jgi:hypothetical protein
VLICQIVKPKWSYITQDEVSHEVSYEVLCDVFYEVSYDTLFQSAQSEFEFPSMPSIYVDVPWNLCFLYLPNCAANFLNIQ